MEEESDEVKGATLEKGRRGAVCRQAELRKKKGHEACKGPQRGKTMANELSGRF